MMESEKRHGQDRADLEGMSTAGLEDLLVQDFRAPEGEEKDGEMLYHAARVLAQREPGPANAAERAWESFEENYLPFAKNGRSLYEDGVPPSSAGAPGRRSPLWRWGKRTGLAAAALAALLLCVSAGAAAGGYGLWGRILTFWTDEDISLAPGQLEAADREEIHIPEEPWEFDSLGEALADCGFDRAVAPRWLPEGFGMDDMVVDLFADELIFYAHYDRDGDNLVIWVSLYLSQEEADSGNYTSFQKDAGAPVSYEAGGMTHMLATNAGRPMAVWANGAAECAVSGDITMDELKRMIDSIYE